MFRKFQQMLEQKEQAFRNSFGHDITDPVERRRSQWHVDWLDHGILRRRWHNFAPVAPGVFRSNQPDHRRLAAYAQMGIRTVLNLRGPARQPHYLFEVESCAALGLTLINVQMAARRAPGRADLALLIDTFDRMERPFLIHCKSGADRTGLAAALYLMIHHNADVATARRQLSLRYIHIRRTSTGILDHFLDVYAARAAQSPITIRDWIATEYDPDALTQSFAAKQAALWPWQGWV